MTEILLAIIVGLYLLAMAVIDGRKKRIPILPGVICLVCVIAGQIVIRTCWQFWISGMLVGVVLFAVSKVSRGAIGEGDALVYTLTGALLGITGNMELLLISLLLCSLVSLGLIVFRRVGRQYKIAFVPFIAIAYGVVVIV